MDGNDGSGNILSVVDNFINTGDTLGNAHTGDTCEVKSLQSHLSGRFPDTLGSNGTDCLPRLHNALVHLLDVNLEEVVKLIVSDSIKTIP